jgi:hypothetical protein
MQKCRGLRLKIMDTHSIYDGILGSADILTCPLSSFTASTRLRVTSTVEFRRFCGDYYSTNWLIFPTGFHIALFIIENAKKSNESTRHTN